MFLYNGLMMTYTGGRNQLPDNKYSTKIEFGVTENIAIHLDFKLF